MATILRATIAYWALLFTIRVIGRRAVNQMTPFELILLFLIGGMSIQAVVYDDRSLTNALLAVFTIGMNHVGTGWLRSNVSGRGWRHSEAKPAHERCAGGDERYLLPCGCGGRRNRVRLRY